MLFPDSRILIFAKAPVAGYAKTRLIPALGAQGATDLYRGLLQRTVEMAVAADLAPVQLWCSPDTTHPFLRQLAANYHLPLYEQVEGDLGARMYFAANRALQEAKAVLLIGADCPVLSALHLHRSLEWLSEGDDAVLGPAEDGGYVLMGLRQSDALLFENMPWSTDQLLIVTRSRLSTLNWRWQELEPLWDVDLPSDLERLKASGLLL